MANRSESSETDRSPGARRSSSAESPSRWSGKLISVAGIDVRVHASFFLLLAFVAITAIAAGQGSAQVVRGVLLVVTVFGTVVLHELGHALVARRFGIRTRDITLYPIGGIARLEKLPETPREQLLVSLAGPAVNVVIAGALFLVVHLVQPGLSDAPFMGGPFLAQLMWINVSLAAFNLLPGYPMDGGRILRALLAMRLPPERATQIAARVGQGVAVIFAAVGLYRNPLLLLIAFFVWSGAKAEHAMSTVKVALAQRSVRDAMVTFFEVLAPTDTLADAVQLTLTHGQRDFPVVDGERLLGVLSHHDVMKGLAESGDGLTVGSAMASELDVVSPSDPLVEVLLRLQQSTSQVALVTDQTKLVGLLTSANVGELLAMSAAGQHGAGAVHARA